VDNQVTLPRTALNLGSRLAITVTKKDTFLLNVQNLKRAELATNVVKKAT